MSSARADALGLRDREARRDVIARMCALAAGARRHVDVVEVEVAEGGAVGEGGEIGRGAAVCADHGRRSAARRERDLAADAHRRVVERREPAAERVGDDTLDLLDCRGVEIVVAKLCRIGGEALGKGRGLGARGDRPRGGAGGELQGAAARKSHGRLRGASFPRPGGGWLAKRAG